MGSIGGGPRTYVILLRGVTPTGKNRVPMDLLRAALIKAGLEDARTYIQSGNVVASSRLDRRELEQLVHDAIKAKIGADITVLARTTEELGSIFNAVPFSGTDTSKLYFTVLASAPDEERIKAFRAIDFSPEKVELVGDAVYTLYATKLSDSKYHNNFYESRLKVRATTRNFNTMRKLVEMSATKSESELKEV